MNENAFKKRDKISHELHGEGVVLDAAREYTTVHYDGFIVTHTSPLGVSELTKINKTMTKEKFKELGRKYLIALESLDDINEDGEGKMEIFGFDNLYDAIQEELRDKDQTCKCSYPIVRGYKPNEYCSICEKPFEEKVNKI